MALSCSICVQQKKASIPIVWCQECEKLLCQSCNGQHQRSKATKEHHLIAYDDYRKLPPFILTTKLYCTKHNENYTKFCRIHDEPICIKCQSQFHKKCAEIPNIEDIVHNVKDSVLFEDIVPEIETVCGTLNKIAAEHDENLKQIKNMRHKMEKRIECITDKAINHLKKLKEKTILDINSVCNKHINSVCNKLTTNISSTSQILQSKERDLHEFLNQKDKMIQFASDLQFLIGVKKIESTVHETNVYIQGLAENEKLQVNSISLDINETIEDIICGIDSLGEIRVNKTPSAVTIHRIRPMEAQKEVHRLESERLHIQQKIDLENGWYTGCCTLLNGLMVFVDSNNHKVSIHKSDGLIKSTIKFKVSEGVYDVTPVDDNHVAVSHPDSKAISVIRADKNKVIKTIPTGERVMGLCCKEREIVCCVPRRGLVKVNLDSGKVELIVNESLGTDSHVTVTKKFLCYTCPHTSNTVITVLNSKYNVAFTYKDNFKASLNFPSGVTSDDHNNIYVTGYKSDNLVVISSDGSSCHQLLGKGDGLKYPSAVHYDSSSRKLMVINGRGPAFIYSLR